MNSTNKKTWILTVSEYDYDFPNFSCEKVLATNDEMREIVRLLEEKLQLFRVANSVEETHEENYISCYASMDYRHTHIEATVFSEMKTVNIDCFRKGC